MILWKFVDMMTIKIIFRVFFYVSMEMYYIMWIFKLRYCVKKFVNSDVLYYLKNYNILQLLHIVLKCLLFRNIFNDQSFR